MIDCCNIEAEHQATVKKVLQQCIEHGLAVNLLKSEFHVKETIFLENVINGQEVTMDPLKLETMSKWPVPTKKKEVQAFLGFANYYSRFIVNYSTKARPVIDLTRDIFCTWRHTQQQDFDELQARFISAPILTQFDRPSRQSYKLMLAIKQLLVSCLNLMSSTDASSYIQLSTMQKPSPSYNATGQSMIRNSSLLWTTSGNGETG